MEDKQNIVSDIEDGHIGVSGLQRCFVLYPFQ